MATYILFQAQPDSGEFPLRDAPCAQHPDREAACERLRRAECTRAERRRTRETAVLPNA